MYVSKHNFQIILLVLLCTYPASIFFAVTYSFSTEQTILSFDLYPAQTIYFREGFILKSEY